MIAATQPTARTSHYDAVRMLPPEALLQALRSDVRLAIIDVRDRPEIRVSGTLEGARTFPLPQLGPRIAELEHLRATPIVVVSERARRARTAALGLQASGFGEVFVLEGGLQAWLALGYPVEARRESMPSSRP